MQSLKSKIRVSAFFIILLLIAAGTAHSSRPFKGVVKDSDGKEPVESSFPYSKDISCKDYDSDYGYVYLDAEVYRHARDDLADLRILDGAGNFAPYYIESGSTEFRQREITARSRKIGQRYDPKSETSYFDFQILPDAKGKIPLGRRLLLTVDRPAYSKQVILYGRHEETSWDFIKQDSIYSFESYLKKEIAFDDDLDYHFYRIEIRENPERVSVTKLVLHGYSDTRYQKLSRTQDLHFSVKEDGTETVIAIKNPDRLKLFTFTLDIDGTFKRMYTIYTEYEYRDQNRTGRTRKVMNRLTGGEIFNFIFKNIKIAGKKIDLLNSPVQDKIIYIRIQNNNDRPLKIEGISGGYYIDKIVYKGGPDIRYRLCFGNPKAESPVYDIVSYRSYIDREDKAECTLDSIKGESDSKTGKALFPDSTVKLIFNVIIALVALLLVIFLVRQLALKK